MEVYISASENPNLFWIHVVGPMNRALDNLMLEMAEYYNEVKNRKLHSLKNVKT